MDRNLIIEDHRNASDNTIYCADLLAALPSRQQQAALLFSWGYTQVQIAEEMGVSHQAVNGLLKKAVNNLKGVAKRASKRGVYVDG